jgi:hypothetical protein
VQQQPQLLSQPPQQQVSYVDYRHHDHHSMQHIHSQESHQQLYDQQPPQHQQYQNQQEHHYQQQQYLSSPLRVQPMSFPPMSGQSLAAQYHPPASPLAPRSYQSQPPPPLSQQPQSAMLPRLPSGQPRQSIPLSPMRTPTYDFYYEGQAPPPQQQPLPPVFQAPPLSVGTPRDLNRHQHQSQFTNQQPMQVQSQLQMQQHHVPMPMQMYHYQQQYAPHADMGGYPSHSNARPSIDPAMAASYGQFTGYPVYPMGGQQYSNFAGAAAFEAQSFAAPENRQAHGFYSDPTVVPRHPADDAQRYRPPQDGTALAVDQHTPRRNSKQGNLR